MEISITLKFHPGIRCRETTANSCIEYIENTTLEISNVKGQLVDEIEISNQQESIMWIAEDLSSGVYYYTVNCNESPIKKTVRPIS